MATTAQVIEALKYVYGVNKVQYLFNDESPTWAILSKQKKPMGGRGQFIIPTMTKNAGAFTGISEGGTLPTALQPDTAEATFALQEYTAVYNVTWKLIQDARSDKFAFQQAVQMLDDSLKRRVMKNLNSDLIGTGLGELATLTGADTTGSLPCAYLPRCEKGMRVDLVDASDDDTKLAAGYYVQNVDPIARTVLIGDADDNAGDAISNEAAGDYLVIMDTTDVTSAQCWHSHGLLGVVSDSNPGSTAMAAVRGYYGGINRSTSGNEYWKSVKLSNSGTNRPFTEDLGIQAMDSMREKGSGRLKAFLSNQKVVRQYHNILRAESFASFGDVQALGNGVGLGRSNGAGKPSEDGKSIYQFSGVPWHVDPYFTNNVIIGLDTDHFFIGTGDNEVPRPISEIFDNIPFFRQTTAATFDVAWYYQMQLLSDNPAAGVQIADVAES